MAGLAAAAAAAPLLLAPAAGAAPAAAVTVTGQLSGAGSLAGLVVRPEGLETASPNRSQPPRGCTAPCTTTAAAGTYSVAAEGGGQVSAVRLSDGAGVQLTVPDGRTALPTVQLWTSAVTASTADGRLQLSWTPPAGADVSGYSVELVSVGATLGRLTTSRTTATVDARLVEDASVTGVVRASGTVDGVAVVWQAPFALVPTSRPVPASRGAQCVVTTASGSQLRDTLGACGLADGDLTSAAELPGGANPQRAALDLGSEQQVGLVVVRASGLVVVQTSDDGATWTTLDTAVEQDPVTGSYLQLLDPQKAARYVAVVAAAGTSPAPTTAASTTPPAETSSPPPPRPTTSAASPTPASSSASPTPRTTTPSPTPPRTTTAAPTTTSPLPLPTTTPPTTTSAAPTTTAATPAAQRAGFRLAPAGLPQLQELSVWTGSQGAIQGDVTPKAVAVPGVAASQRSGGRSVLLPLVGGGVLAVLVVGGGALLVLRRRRREDPGVLGS